MSKREIIKSLIEAGNCFEQVVELSGAKKSYVKAQYTKLDLVWAEHLLENTPKEEPKETEDVRTDKEQVEAEPEAPEVPVEEPKEEENEVQAKKEFVRDHKKPKKIKEKSELYLACEVQLEEAHKAKSPLTPRTKMYRDIAHALLLNEDMDPRKLAMLNSRYAVLTPQPNNYNMYKEVHKLHYMLRDLFKEHYKR
jgi:hypothetical protein